MDIFGEMHETAVDGTTVAWWEAGKGCPLVLLHGLIDSHRTWRRAAPILSGRFRVIMPDLPGFGLSGRPDAPYTTTWFAWIMSGWMEKIGVEKAHVCGHSYGGGVAQWLVLQARERVDRLALVAPGGFGREIGAGLRFLGLPRLGKKIAPVVLKTLMPGALRLYPKLFGNMEAEELDRFLEWSAIPGTNRSFQKTVSGSINFWGQYIRTIDRVGEVKKLPPTALFWGDRDRIIPFNQAYKALSISDGIALNKYEGCGHFPHLEFPARFAADLTGFLQDPDMPNAVVRVV